MLHNKEACLKWNFHGVGSSFVDIKTTVSQWSPSTTHSVLRVSGDQRSQSYICILSLDVQIYTIEVQRLLLVCFLPLMLNVHVI